jgi:hypothetical protein
MITDVWSAGRRLVSEGRHRERDAISVNYRRTILSLRGRL